MSTSLLIFDRLQKEAAEINSTECREHTLEQMHYAISNVQQKSLEKFDSLVKEIASDWGTPEFNARTDYSDENDSKHPVPNWVMGTKVGDATQKVLRMCYWKRDGNVNYIILRMEVDSKDRPNYYNIVLGARRRHKTESVKVDKLRQTDTSLWSWIQRKLGLVKS